MGMRPKVEPHVTALLLVWLLAGNLLAQQQQQQQPVRPSEPGYRVRVTTEMVLVNVIARDKHGNLVRDLKKDDFAVYEDGQKQQLSSFDFENVDALQMAGAAGSTVTGTAGPGALLGTSQVSSL